MASAPVLREMSHRKRAARFDSADELHSLVIAGQIRREMGVLSQPFLFHRFPLKDGRFRAVPGHFVLVFFQSFLKNSYVGLKVCPYMISAAH